MFLAFFLMMLVAIVIWLTLRGCFKRRVTNPTRSRTPCRPLSRPRSRQLLEEVDEAEAEAEDLGPRPITPPRRKWGVQRYVAKWASPQAALMDVSLPQAGIPMTVIKPSSGLQVLHSPFLAF